MLNMDTENFTSFGLLSFCCIRLIYLLFTPELGLTTSVKGYILIQMLKGNTLRASKTLNCFCVDRPIYITQLCNLHSIKSFQTTRLCVYGFRGKTSKMLFKKCVHSSELTNKMDNKEKKAIVTTLIYSPLDMF